MRYFVIFLILIGFSGTAFAMHDPNDPNPHPTMPQIQMQNDTNTMKQFHSQYDKIEFIDGNPFFVSEKYNANPISNETITFHGVNFTHPSYPEIPNPGGFVSTVVTFEDSIKKSVSVGFTPNPIPVLTEHKGVFAGMMRDSDGLHFLVSADLIKISPLKQFKSGIPNYKIQCKEGLKLLIRSSEGPSACVKGDTATELQTRWHKPNDILLEHYKDKPEVKAFYAKYDDVKVSVRNDHVSYVAGNEVDFRVRMNLYFDKNYEIDHIDFNCYVQRQHQTDVPEEFILIYLKDYDCKKYD